MTIHTKILALFSVLFLLFNQQSIGQIKASENLPPTSNVKTGSIIKESQPSSRIDELQVLLDSLAKDQPGLLDTVQLNFRNLSIDLFVNELADLSKVNIDIEQGMDQKIVNNFSNVTVQEILLYLCKKYQLTLERSGRILFLKKYQNPVVIREKEWGITYLNQQIDLDLRNDTLLSVSRQITKLTGNNILVDPSIHLKLVNLFVKDLSTEEALKKLAFANHLEFDKQKDGTFVFSPKEVQKGNKSTKRRSSKRIKNSGVIVDVNPNNPKEFSLDITEAPLNDAVYSILEKADLPFLVHTPLEGKINLKAKKRSAEELLALLFVNQKYYYDKKNEVYIIGERKQEGIVKNELIPINYRKAEGFSKFIPKNLKANLEVTEDTELNSLQVSGSKVDVAALKKYLKEIDLPVPVVNIDIIVIDYSNNYDLETGIKAGIGEKPTNSNGSIYPGIDYNFGSKSINKILGSITGYSTLNLGGVTPNFYLSLKALESNGIVDIKSTPRLSTLNGKEASFKVGRQEYYRTQQTNTIGTQNPQVQTTENWQSVSANLNIKIKPHITINREVILDITFDQTSFTARIAPTAPPGTTNRSLNSSIRVRDNDMILLGGLEEISKNESSSGLPLLSRIPILKWIFGSRNKSKRKSKLLVFIKPTIIL
ncbi:MAG: type II and III secretion system protein [Flavobacteriales bacterium]|jgi:type IV pilus assembly protein PilQ|nr:type II and III secretion system protein [Flavobacteriales bacterium]